MVLGPRDDQKQLGTSFPRHWSTTNPSEPLKIDEFGLRNHRIPDSKICGLKKNMLISYSDLRSQPKCPDFCKKNILFGEFRYDILSERLLPRINSFDPDFFLRSDYVLKFRIFWSITGYCKYINM